MAIFLWPRAAFFFGTRFRNGPRPAMVGGESYHNKNSERRPSWIEDPVRCLEGPGVYRVFLGLEHREIFVCLCGKTLEVPSLEVPQS